MKSYIECMDEINEDELFDGLLGFGLFAEKLPPVFTSKDFCDYCKVNPDILTFSKPRRYVYYESMRNTNISRTLGIPTPVNYAKLCFELKVSWNDIKNEFRNNTATDTYKVSRIHIRKRQSNNSLFEMNYDGNDLNNDVEETNDKDLVPVTSENGDCIESLFSMNYKNWRMDGDPLMDFSLGMKYVIKADISQCFPSAYSHAIPWALVGKDYAKTHRARYCWFNKIDKACRDVKDGETLGFIIGPHASNVLSEILLTAIDKELKLKDYQFIRNIDDYICYTESYDKAKLFLTDLGMELRRYSFTLNHKKTVIEELPQASAEEWIQILRDKQIIGRHGSVDYNTANSYLDTAILVMKHNGNNASSLFFAIKVLGNPNIKITTSAKNYCVKKMCRLAIIYPYLVPNMDKYVFDAFNASVIDIEDFARKLYEDSIIRKNFEGISYALFYAIKYNFIINVDVNEIINSMDCISKIMLWLYAKKIGDVNVQDTLIEEARRIKATDTFDENWIFAYEVLPETELQDDWEILKNAGVSFLKSYE